MTFSRIVETTDGTKLLVTATVYFGCAVMKLLVNVYVRNDVIYHKSGSVGGALI